MEDALRMFNKMACQNVVTWNVILGNMCHERAKVKKFLNIFNICMKNVYNQSYNFCLYFISLLPCKFGK